ncbi:MAG: substrate-binding domain-containing protein, partial [Lachnospiraceae bacterium]|nr:substrate-binding domain-containing protein [Lachnospiraceae bacterium]
MRGRAVICLLAAVSGCVFGLGGCGKAEEKAPVSVSEDGKSTEESNGSKVSEDELLADKDTKDVVNFDRRLDEYQPLKKEYNFYFTYKVIHPWWDAVAIGIEDAAKQYEEDGIIINYEYLAPQDVSAQDQVRRLTEAGAGEFDVIGVDVADVEIVTPMINSLLEDGQKVMTFSSSDAAKEDGCNRIAYVGNTHNYEDGVELTEALCKKLGYQGKIAVLIGTKGAPCHEDRAEGARDAIAKYPDMEIVETAYDEDTVEKSFQLAKEFLARHEDLAGFVCCNMSNPVGATRAVIEAGRENEVVIVGMDHDQEALRYLRDGYIYA